MADLNPCLMCGADLATRELPPLMIEHLHIAGVRAIIAMLRDERYRDCNKVADDLERTISGATQPPPAGVDVSDEMVERLVGDLPRQRELARRLIASGQKAAHVSCSETHEISEFVDDACDYIERTTAAPSRTRGEEG